MEVTATRTVPWRGDAPCGHLVRCCPRAGAVFHRLLDGRGVFPAGPGGGPGPRRGDDRAGRRRCQPRHLVRVRLSLWQLVRRHPLVRDRWRCLLLPGRLLQWRGGTRRHRPGNFPRHVPRSPSHQRQVSPGTAPALRRFGTWAVFLQRNNRSAPQGLPGESTERPSTSAPTRASDSPGSFTPSSRSSGSTGSPTSGRTSRPASSSTTTRSARERTSSRTTFSSGSPSGTERPIPILAIPPSPCHSHHHGRTGGNAARKHR